MMPHRRTRTAGIALLTAFMLWAAPVFAEPTPPKIDWKEFLYLLGQEDPDHAVGEQMC